LGKDLVVASKVDNKKPNVYEYTEAGSFLEASLEHLKASKKGHSLRKFAEEAGVSPGYISLVLAKKRTLSEKMAKKILSALPMDRSESSYFMQLVTLGKSKSQEERFKAFSKIRRYQKYQKVNSFEAESVSFLSNWYISTIKELLSHGGMKADPKAIQKALDYHVSVKNIERALDFLVEKKFIKIDKNKNVKILKKEFFFRDGVFQIALSEHHRQMLNMAVESIDKNHKDERLLTGYSLQLSENTYGKATDILNKALEQIANLENEMSEEEKKRVYHIELAAFPLTGGVKGEE
jgi:uncharacterized protein (TIGR02147 family)